MKILVIGAGYVGLVSAACFSEFGFEVLCVDQDTNKIAGLNDQTDLKVPVYEPGLKDLIAKNKKEQRLKFSADPGAVFSLLQEATLIFIAVGTPSRRDTDEADLKYVETVIDSLATCLSPDHERTVVMKSTVPVGTTHRMAARFRNKNPLLADKVVFASNPEFLREGAAINDFMRPNRIIVGIESGHRLSSWAQTQLEAVYRPLYLFETPLLFMDLASAELTKYASNAFLATKVAFINEMADIAEACGADIQKVAQGMGLDARIGQKFLHPGPGFGGSCFPKDSRALVALAKEKSVPSLLVEAVVLSNVRRLDRILNKILHSMGNAVKGQKMAVLGLAFKPQTDDVRESPALDIIEKLIQRGALIQTYDPSAMSNAKTYFRGIGRDEPIVWAHDPYQAIMGCSTVILVTEWNEFRSLDLNRVQHLMQGPPGQKNFVDLRNVYELKEWQNLDINYLSVGRRIIYADPLCSTHHQ